MKQRTLWRIGLLGGLSLLSALSVAPVVAAEPPGLVLLLAVDQLRRDRIDPTLPGGIGRLAREGRVYRDAMLDHAMTETCPGHAVIATGRSPARVGVPGNYFLDPATQQRRYCVEDRTEQGRVLGQGDADPGNGRSPRNLRVDALGDWLKAASPQSRVYAIAGKDRAAIALGGKQPDGVFWLSRSSPVGFTTSRYYADALPPWLVAWNGSNPLTNGILADLPLRWHHEPAAAKGAPREDDFRGEGTEFGRTSGHPLREGGDERTVAKQVFASPWLDEITIELATRLLAKEKLGQRGVTDVLALGLSATDLVGHMYGPRSHEARDALLRLDASLGRLIALAEQKIGRGRVLVVLTADHGVLELPEWLEQEGRRSCPARDLRLGLVPLFVGLSWNLHLEFGGLFSIPQQWVEFAGGQLAVRRSVTEARGVAVGEVVRAAEAYLEGHDEIARAWTLAEVQGGTSTTAALYRNSVDPERSGDLMVEVEPTCLVQFLDVGTTHGSPHVYDRAIPLIFLGPGVEPGKIDGPAASIDIAPTLAALLGWPIPADVDGRVLFGGGGE